MKNIKLTDILRDKVKPFLSFPELNLKFYHPRYLPEIVSIEISESRLYSNFVIDQTTKLQDELDALSAEDLINEENWKKRKTLFTKIQEKQTLAGSHISTYVYKLAKLNSVEELDEIIEEYLSKNNLSISPLVVLNELFSFISEGLAEYDKEENEKIKKGK
jgi:hypothetical protein